MAQFTCAPASWTTAAVAASANLVNSNYQSIRSWSVTVVDRITEIYVGGEATSSTVIAMAARRNGTQATTPTNVVAAGLSPFSAAPAGNFHQLAATPGVTGAVTAQLLKLSLNAFGGVVRWVAAPGEELYVIGATAPNNEISLSAITGSALIGAHVIFEEM